MKYATMTPAERWNWHSEVYAFRRVILGLHEDQVPAPTDPKFEWHDENLIAAAENRLRAKINQQRVERERQKEARDRQMILEGRALAHEWAQRRGFQTIDEYAQANYMDVVDAYAELCRENLAKVKIMPREEGD